MKKVILIFTMIFLLVLSFASAQEQQGQASWYGGKFHGRLTASGERFNTYDFTAAHKTLPFGTMVEVTNLNNGKSVLVRINDRGPFIEGRIIDLSYAAADKIDMLQTGVAHVNIRWENLDEQQSYTIQVAAFSRPEYALNLKTQLEDLGFQPETELSNSGIIRILLRNISEEDSFSLVRKLESMGLEDILIRQD